jgi:hypothetical protein
MNGELRAAKRRLDSGSPTSMTEGWVMAFKASGTSPRKALCHDTVLGCEAVDGDDGAPDHMHEQADICLHVENHTLRKSKGQRKY